MPSMKVQMAEGSEFFGDPGASTVQNTVKFGVIILGNSGVGKSFFANVLLEEDVFEQACRSSSVTHVTEFREHPRSNEKYSAAIFNVPGLIESDQQAIDRNKQEIYKAFEVRPKSIIAFVFLGSAGGRIRNEDIIAFKAINEAYGGFNTKSLLLIVNDLPDDRPEDYDSETAVRLLELLKLDSDCQFLFLSRIDKTSTEARQKLRDMLTRKLTKMVIHEHRKTKNINLFIDKLKALIDAVELQQQKFDQQLRAIKEFYEMLLEQRQSLMNLQQYENELIELKEMIEEQRRKAVEEAQTNAEDLCEIQ